MADPKEQTSAKPVEAPSVAPTAAPVEQKPLPPDVKQSVTQGQQKLGALREEVGMPQAKTAAESPPLKQEGPTVAPGAPKTNPTVAPPGVPGQPGVPSAVKPPEKGKNAIPTRAQIENMSMGELITGMFESLGNLVDSFKGFGGNILAKLQQKVGEKFTDDEVKKIQVDLEKSKDKIYPTQDKSTEYVTSVLNLPVRPDPHKFLNALQSSGLVFQQDIGKLKELQVGDVLFFQKPEKKGVPYLTAVVSKTEPLTMRTIPRSGGAPQDIILMQSDYFKNEWLGFVRIPRKPDQAPPTALAKPEDKKDQKPATPGEQPAPVVVPGSKAPYKMPEDSSAATVSPPTLDVPPATW